MCLPHEDQKGVALLHLHAPPAGQIMCCTTHYPSVHQHPVCQADCGRHRPVPPLQYLCAISPGEGGLLGAAATRGAPPLIFFVELLTYSVRAS